MCWIAIWGVDTWYKWLSSNIWNEWLCIDIHPCEAGIHVPTLRHDRGLSKTPFLGEKAPFDKHSPSLDRLHHKPRKL